MYCKKCGFKNNPENIYCVNDGVPLSQPGLDIYKGSNYSRFCSGCGTARGQGYIYCSSCGYSFFDQEKGQEEDPSRVDVDSVISAGLNGFKNVGKKLEDMGIPRFTSTDGSVGGSGLSNFLYGSIGILIMLVFSLVFANSINFLVSRYVFEGLGVSSEVFRTVRIFNFLDALLIMNGPRVELVIDVLGGESLRIFIQGGVMPFILLPILSFLVLGYIKTRDDLGRRGEIDLLGLLTNGLVYALFVAVITLTRKTSSQVNLGIFRLNMIKTYSFLTSFMNSLVLYLLGSLIGYGFAAYRSREDRLSNPLRNVFLGGGFFGLVGLVTILAGLGAIAFKEPASSRTSLKGLIGLVRKFKASGIFLSLANMGSLSLESLGEIKNFTAFSKDLKGLGLVGNYLVFFLIIIGFIFLVFFIFGRRSKEIGDDSFYISPIVYGICIYLFSLMQNYSYSSGRSDFLGGLGDLSGQFVSGTGDFRLLIGAVLLSLAASSVGYLLTRQVVDDE